MCFSFEASRIIKLIQWIAANLNCGYFKESTFSNINKRNVKRVFIENVIPDTECKFKLSASCRIN